VHRPQIRRPSGRKAELGLASLTDLLRQQDAQTTEEVLSAVGAPATS
jgi:hypothetical protein